jgi:uncharacterized membrane protein
MVKKVKAKTSAGKVENEKVCALLSYLLIGIIWYFVDERMKQSALAKYHAKQGLVLLIAAICYDIVLGILIAIIVAPFVLTGMFIGALGIVALLNILYYVPLIFMIIGIINALNEKQKPLPIIGHFAEKFSF